MMTIKNKKGFEFSFGWIFAIIVGAVILFLALYAVSNIVKDERKISDTEAGKQLGIILSPLETGIGSNKITLIHFPIETRIYNDCDIYGNFGEQKISIATKSGVGNAWDKPGKPSIFYNKYIFSPSIIEGKDSTAFSKSLALPFKVTDLIYLIPPEDYCFVNPPRAIEQEIIDSSPKNINVSLSIAECKKGSKKICFGSFRDSKCNTFVDIQEKSVRKGSSKVYYEDDSENSLLYSAIFAEPEIYECQLKRLMKRTTELSLLYIAKSQALSPRGCSSNLELDIQIYANATLSFNNSADLPKIIFMSEELKRRNGLLSCSLF